MHALALDAPAGHVPFARRRARVAARDLLSPSSVDPPPENAPPRDEQPPEQALVDPPLTDRLPEGLQPAEQEFSGLRFAEHPPAQLQPAESQLVQPEPAEPEPAEPEPIEPEPIEPETIEPEYIGPEPVEPESIEPESIQQEPVEPDPIEHDPAVAQFVEQLPIEPESAEPQPVEQQLHASHPVERQSAAGPSFASSSAMQPASSSTSASPSLERVILALQKAIRSCPLNSLLVPALRSILNPVTHLSHIATFAEHHHASCMRSIIDFAGDVHALLRHRIDHNEAQQRLTELHASALSLQRDLDAKGFTTSFQPSHLISAKINTVLECLNHMSCRSISLSDLKRVLLSLPALYTTLEYLCKLPVEFTSLGIAMRSAIQATAVLSSVPPSNQAFAIPSTERLAAILKDVQAYKDSVEDSTLPDNEKDMLRDCIQTILQLDRLTSDRIRITTYPKHSFSLPHEIGRSTHTTVYKAAFSMRHGPAQLWTTTVALKALHLSFSSRLRHLHFLQESLRLQSFSHPCLPTLYGVNWPFSAKDAHSLIQPVRGVAAAPVALVATELMTHDLQQARQQPCLRPLSARVRVLRDLADALCYLHRSNVFHGHVIPQNVMLRIHDDCLYGNTKLDVTGLLGRALLSKQQKSRCTKNLLYFAPEQIVRGMQYFTGDVWSFGMIACYLLLDGPHLLHNPSEDAIFRLIVDKTLVDSAQKWCEQISDEGLRQIVRGCLEEDPSQRFDSQVLFDHMQAAVERLPYEAEENRVNRVPYEDVDDVVLDSSGNNPIVVDLDADDEVSFVGKKRPREDFYRSPPRRRRARIIEHDDNDSEPNGDPESKAVMAIQPDGKLSRGDPDQLCSDGLQLASDENGDWSESFRLFRQAADLGNHEAMRYCGQFLLNGWGTKQDYFQALKYLKEAARLEDPESIRLLGVCFEEGRGVTVNYSEAFRLYKKAANLGDACANTHIGLCYEKGIGVRKSRKSAITYYKRAADEEDDVALNNLGVLYNQGPKPDYVQAIYYYREAIKNGSAEAQCNLGDCYMYGQGVAKDYSTAMDLYKESAEKGNLGARAEMATLYYLGLGVPVNHAKAISLYREASSISEAVRWLGTAHYDGNGVTQSVDEAVTLYRQAIDMGNADANLNLGMCYFQGKGVPQSYDQALECYKLAAENGSKEASILIGNMYFEGLGVRQDLTLAFKMYKDGRDVDFTYVALPTRYRP
ncbi:Secretory immunoglobulin A-binding protein EsiB [Gracilariopsis chorda]|uniref:Secretory immunoglobulin A-binding protein EsiB n=1 Tax=Gracilariopsis chorda TaxID=448386 RepID=A0A2V3IXS1_9FLOR|nr:Secretory immunoglobulin A-binding protein EsiB [Gracilariopsis chorda]|eukprot:PXF46911.1 Secretory immunoglobulin A-binding protein EsiB [Gracilariopsis chorda]